MERESREYGKECNLNVYRILVSVIFLVTLSILRVSAEKDRSAMEQVVRKPAVAGQFYTDNPTSLRAEIQRYIDAVGTQDTSGDVIAIVSPHAGYMYSGGVAAYGYSLVAGKDYETVVVIAPSHVEYFDFCSVFPGKAYITPLGGIPIDKELVQAIASKSDRVRAAGEGHLFEAYGRGEHSLEVQLPFLQVVLGSFKLVAIVMGDQRRENIEALGRALGEALEGRNALIVASTDLSHFHNGETARQLDGIFMEELGSFDENGLLQALANKYTEACGGGPTGAAMIAARMLGADRCEILNYAHSGDVTGDTRNVVGYVSAAMIDTGAGEAVPDNDAQSRLKKNNPGPSHPIEGAGLSEEDKTFLLRLARRVIEAECSGDSVAVETPPSPIMQEKRGGFVTLKKNGQLRGCIGYIEAVKPLVTTIEEMARAAAFRDWRFKPVTADEIDALEIEISILSPIQPIDDPSVIEVGRHGIIITRGTNRGLLLPQVATEWKWDREQFLEQTCAKAGLPADAWKREGTQIEIFSAEIFSERELGIR
ncbi:MAG: AmmeMemoRadiSam system protein B [bacterium]|nr:MAG: AmmeMemoRadiSam system protein B [bacterium]